MRVGCAQLAEHLGCSRYAAYRLLCKLEKRHSGLVTRTQPGNELSVDLRKMQNVMATSGPGSNSQPNVLRELSARVDELEQRLDAEVAARQEFQRQSHAWMTRLDKTT